MYVQGKCVCYLYFTFIKALLDERTDDFTAPNSNLVGVMFRAHCCYVPQGCLLQLSDILGYLNI